MAVYKQDDVFAGRYALKQLIGEGGFSEVWKAQDQMAEDAVVALKIYAPEKGLDDFGVNQFRKEFALTYHIAHPHLMKVYHFDISDGSPYLIMPFCPFGSLAKIVVEEGTFNEQRIALLMCQIGSALKELHNQDSPILHQDIKPDNILALNPEYFLLADFGISSQIRHTLRKSTASARSLTVAYAPPERFDRFPVSDTASDIFSLGVTLYEMCTNSIPWDGSGGQSLLKGAHIPNLPETYSREFNQLLQRCMAVDRRTRPAAEEIYLRGRHFLETGKWKLPKKDKKGSPTFLKSRKGVSLLAAAFIALVVVFWFYNGKSFTPSGQMASVINASGASELAKIKELEGQINGLEVRLLEANKELVKRDSIEKAVLAAKEEQILHYEGALAEKDALLVSYKGKKQPVARKENSLYLTKGLEQYLNKISDPKNSRKDRQIWKQEISSQFATGSVPVLAEVGEVREQYQAEFFLNLLTNVHYQVVIREVKRNQHNKVTELIIALKAD